MRAFSTEEALPARNVEDVKAGVVMSGEVGWTAMAEAKALSMPVEVAEMAE